MSYWSVYGTEEMAVATEVEAATMEEAISKFERGEIGDSTSVFHPGIPGRGEKRP